MREILENLWQSWKDFAVNILLRKIIIPVMLTLTYFLFIGPFSIVAKLVARKMLNQNSLKDESFWVKSSGHEPDPVKLLRQS